KFVDTLRHFESERLDLVMLKGVFPYEWLSSIERQDDAELPPIEAFHSKLSDSNISEADYEHAHKVWSSFGMKYMKDYHDLYLKTDVLLLSEIFERFRQTSLEHYKIDPAHCYTAPGLSFQACLQKTGVKLELLTEIDQLLFIESGIRGGTSYVANCLPTVKNEYVGLDQSDPEKHIMYLDATNLYGWAMSQKSPI